MAMCAALAVFLFGVPLSSSLPALLAISSAFLIPAPGQGMLISAAIKNQFVASQIALLSGFLPAFLLSGFVTPIENMPEWLQTFTMVNPLRHFLVIVLGVFQKGMPAADVAENILPLAVIAVFTMTATAWLFRSRIE